MRKILLSSVALAAFVSGSAMAADLPVRAPAYKAPVIAPVINNWTGFYIGIDGGWGRADFDHTFNIAGHYNLAAGNTFDYSHSGGIFGGHAGYNWQSGQWVFGIEGGAAKTWIKAQNVVSPFFPVTDRWTSEVKSIASITPRLGVAFGSALLYVKGGVAFASIRDHVNDNFDFVDVKFNRSGWTVGAGLEYMVAPNWVVGVEYDHYDFGSRNITSNSTLFAGGTFFPGTNHNLDVRVDAVVGRVSYKFGGPVVAAY
ncbi:MAG: outer rane immunogenic protein [Alphaproteobacteria bacterium]|jgi:outer membrane immunogenic protein|nr:outer rane immunogenic protein [Alphaproteobacteria bacterium]